MPKIKKNSLKTVQNGRKYPKIVKTAEKRGEVSFFRNPTDLMDKSKNGQNGPKMQKNRENSRKSGNFIIFCKSAGFDQNAHGASKWSEKYEKEEEEG